MHDSEHSLAHRVWSAVAGSHVDPLVDLLGDILGNLLGCLLGDLLGGLQGDLRGDLLGTAWVTARGISWVASLGYPGGKLKASKHLEHAL